MSVCLLIAVVSSLAAASYGGANGATRGITLCVEPSPALEPFIEELGVPSTIDVSQQDEGPFRVGAYKITQKLHRDLPETTLYAYGEDAESAAFPGPTIMARHGVAAQIRWENHILDSSHFLPVDDTIFWASPPLGGVPTVAHLHGGEVGSASDGHPDAWFTSDNQTGPAFLTQTYTYPNAQPPAALWYHDHTIGISRLNNMAGLSGFYILSDRTSGGLPAGIPLLVKDWRFFANGSLNFRVRGSAAGDESWCPEYGDTMLVNGKVWPYLKVNAGGVYRFRLLNACNARFLNLSLIPSDDGSGEPLSFLQLGTDGGFLPEPRQRAWLLMSPGERVDFLLNFTAGAENGTEVLLSNSAQSPFPYADASYFGIGTADVMKFVVVTDGSGTVDGLLEGDVVLAEVRAVSVDVRPEEVAVRRMFNLTRTSATEGRPQGNTINDEKWEDGIEDQVSVAGDAELWEIVNVSEDAHNMQIHLVQFQMLDQQSFDMDVYTSGGCSVTVPYGSDGSCLLEQARGPEPYQEGWKDTLIMWPSNVTRVFLRFAARDGGALPADIDSGCYVWNSATPDHEDFQMLKRFCLLSQGGGSVDS